MRALLHATAGIVALGVATAVFAQERRGATPGDFDFYVLALSWSPGFCETTGDKRGSSQCETGRKLGFVTHGLWPQNEHGYPTNCGGGRGLPAPVMDEAKRVYPEGGLARHEWRMHGTCSGLPPADYVKAVAAARAKVTVPDPLLGMEREGQTTPQNLERAFVTANAGLRPDMMAVTCARGVLQDVRICLEKDLSGFRRCPDVDRSACRFGPIRIPAPH